MLAMRRNKNAFSVFKTVLVGILIVAFPFLVVLGFETFTIVRDMVKEGSPVHIERAKIEFGPYTWLVLYESEDKKLIITKEIIAQLPFQTDFGVRYATWETSSIRQFLNGRFLQDFAAKEKERIAETHVENSDNLWFSYHGSMGGGDTVDKIFLLSLEEVDRYFGNSGDYLNRRGWILHEGLLGRWMRLDNNELSGGGTRLSTRYDVGRVAVYDGKPSRWWLRSPGILPSFVASVWADGSVNVGGESFVSTTGYRSQGVRPALWLYL